MPIVATEDVLGGKPRLEGHRISVLQVAELVLDHGEDPGTACTRVRGRRCLGERRDGPT